MVVTMNQQLMSVMEKACDRIFDLWIYRPQMKWAAPKVIAHRGAWDLMGCHENTILSFERARMIGVYGVEFDIHFTKDGVPVVHHDSSLSRIFRHPGSLKDMTLAEIRAVTPDLPTLEEVLELTGLHFMIEFKTELSREKLQTLQNILQKREPLRDYHCLAIDPALVRESSSLPTQAWILVGELDLRSRVDLAIERKYAGVAGHYLGLSRAQISRLHENGLKAGVGFIPTRNLLYREWQRKVDWVFTNTPGRVI